MPAAEQEPVMVAGEMPFKPRNSRKRLKTNAPLNAKYEGVLTWSGSAEHVARRLGDCHRVARDREVPGFEELGVCS